MLQRPKHVGQDMELVHHDQGMRTALPHSLPIGLAHIHDHRLHVLLARPQLIQELFRTGLATAHMELHDLLLLGGIEGGEITLPRPQPELIQGQDLRRRLQRPELGRCPLVKGPSHRAFTHLGPPRHRLHRLGEASLGQLGAKGLRAAPPRTAHFIWLHEDSPTSPTSKTTPPHLQEHRLPP